MHPIRVAISANLQYSDGRSIISPDALARLNRVPGVHYEFLKERRRQITPEQIQGTHILIQSGLVVNEATFAEGAEDLTYVCLYSLGYDTVDLPACTVAGVAVTRTRGISKHTVASGALLLMLALSKRLMDKQRIVYQGDWAARADLFGHDIQHKVLGIVGLGDIGRELVRIVQPFEMTILASDPYVDDDVFRDLGVERTNLDDLLARSDLVSLHCALTDETRGLIGRRELRLMKSTAYLVNTARGPVVDQPALIEALREGWIAGAGLDVFEVEPLPADDPLTKLDNVILTPHTIGTSLDSIQRGNEMIINQVEHAARGEIPEHVLNPEVLDTPAFQRKLERLRERVATDSAAKASDAPAAPIADSRKGGG